MDSLISRQAAIEAIVSQEAVYADDAIDILRSMPSAQRWIPVAERLPEEDGVFLVYAPNYTGGISSANEWHMGVMFSCRKKGKWSVEHGYYERPNCVVAWMPLPEPYKEEGDE